MKNYGGILVASNFMGGSGASKQEMEIENYE